MTKEERKVIDAMRYQGGGFVEALSYAFNLANDTNFNRLKNAFPEIWKEYETRAKLESFKKNEDPVWGRADFYY